MDTLRKSFFIVALVLVTLILLVELGSTLLPGKAGSISDIRAQLSGDDLEALSSISEDQLQQTTPPGVGIPSLALLDGLMVLALGLMAASFFLTDRVIGRVQGIITLVVSFLVLVAAILLIIGTLIKVFLMIGLFVAVPFGTIAYLAMWGFFSRGGAAAILGLLLVLKLCFAGSLILAHPRFLQNKGLVGLILTSLLANLIISFLHGFVPLPLVSITDGIAGIIVLILAAIWAIILLVGAIIAVIKAVA